MAKKKLKNGQTVQLDPYTVSLVQEASVNESLANHYYKMANEAHLKALNKSHKVWRAIYNTYDTPKNGSLSYSAQTCELTCNKTDPDNIKKSLDILELELRIKTLKARLKED